jgi:hypothetical protein
MAFNYKIPVQSFEIIRDRIALIIAAELKNQYDLYGGFNPSIWIERFIPFDFSELPAVNIVLDNLNLTNKNPGKCYYDVRYNIQVSTKGEDVEGISGDVTSSIDCQKITGMIRYILENPNNLRLQFLSNPSIVSGNEISEILISKPEEKDGNYVVVSQLGLKVKTEETNGEVSPVIGETYITTMKIEATNKGLKLVTNNNI